MKTLNEEINKIKKLFNYKLGNLITEQDEVVTTGDTTPFKDISGYDVNSLPTIEGQYPRVIKNAHIRGIQNVYGYDIDGKIHVKVPQNLGGNKIYIYDKSTFERELKANDGFIPEGHIETISHDGEESATERYQDIIDIMKKQKSNIKVEVNENTPKISLSSLKGKPFILDFWATWCGPCKQSMKNVLIPLLGDVRRKGDRSLHLYFYSVDSDINALKTYVDKNLKGLGINVVGEKGKESEGVKTYNVDRYPTTLVFDKDGNNLGKLPKDLEEAKKMIYPLLGLTYVDSNDVNSNDVEPTAKGKE
jgi:thiol-disulfide isomerase/thioredoxin